MRPADVCGWKRKPFSSRSAIALRTVAAETPSPNRLATVRLPAGSAVSTYVRITASRMRSSRSLSTNPALAQLYLVKARKVLPTEERSEEHTSELQSQSNLVC